jgi:phage tail sheath protein FI
MTKLKLKAANPGSWGNNLQIQVDYDVAEEVAKKYGLEKSDLFNLTVKDLLAGALEEFRNLSIKDSPRRVDLVLANESKLVRIDNWDPAREFPAESDPKKPLPKLDGGNDGKLLQVTDYNASESDKKGIYALEKADIFNLLCIPPDVTDGDLDPSVISEAAVYCEKRRAMLIVDPPSSWTDKQSAKDGLDAIGTKSKNSALYFPRLIQPNPLRDNQMESFVPCGAVAGVIARTDTQRGIWKAPAGLDAGLVGVPQLSVPLTDMENGELNPLGINCLRAMPAAGRVIWGARTLQGNDRLSSEWKYIPVRRMALYIEESLYRGTQWVVFEPNDEPLWAQIRLNVGSFMHGLFRQGAFQGASPKEAYFVKCDKETTIQDDINKGIVNILVGFAPLKPAEFVVIKIQQMAGEIET